MGKLYRLWGPLGEAPGSGVSISFPKGQLFSTLQSNGQEEMGWSVPSGFPQIALMGRVHRWPFAWNAVLAGDEQNRLSDAL